jgi:hypothetical protein
MYTVTVRVARDMEIPSSYGDVSFKDFKQLGRKLTYLGDI